MIERIKQLIKGIRHPPGKYCTVDNMENRRGESVDELFERRGIAIMERIRASYPTMIYENYMKIPVNNEGQDFKGEYFRQDKYPDDGIGMVFYCAFKPIKVVLYKLIGVKDDQKI